MPDFSLILCLFLFESASAGESGGGFGHSRLFVVAHSNAICLSNNEMVRPPWLSPMLGTLCLWLGLHVAGVSSAVNSSDGFPKQVGPFLVWTDDAYSKYERNEFHYSKHIVGDSSMHGCCATHVHVLWERRKDEHHAIDTKYPLVVAVPNFVCTPQVCVLSLIHI